MWAGKSKEIQLYPVIYLKAKSKTDMVRSTQTCTYLGIRHFPPNPFLTNSSLTVWDYQVLIYTQLNTYFATNDYSAIAALLTHGHKLKPKPQRLKSLGLLEKHSPHTPITYKAFKMATAKLPESWDGETIDSAPTLKSNVCSTGYSWLNSPGGVVLRRAGHWGGMGALDTQLDLLSWKWSSHVLC